MFSFWGWFDRLRLPVARLDFIGLNFLPGLRTRMIFLRLARNWLCICNALHIDRFIRFSLMTASRFLSSPPTAGLAAGLGILAWMGSVRAEPDATAAPVPTPSIAGAMGFETPGAWTTMPKLDAEDLRALAHCNQESRSMDWVMPAVSEQDLAGGVKLSREHVKEGKFSGEWRDHPRYPTIACSEVPADWTKSGGVRFWAYSEAATHETITFGVLADDPATPALDYYTADFKVDWTGWKEIRLLRRDFVPLGHPAGWSRVQGVCFFSKFARRSPDPRTALFLDDLALLPAEKAAPGAANSSAPAPGDVAFSVAYSNDAPVDLNHGGPEIAPAVAGARHPFLQTPFFLGVRAHQKYFPRYDPGYAYFDPKGNVCLRNPGMNEIESLDASGRWQRRDLSKALKDFARERHWEGIAIAWGGDPTIRFDEDGDVYALVDVRHFDAGGREADPHDRQALLLHSRDQGQTWTVYPLPGRMADFEKLDGHNADCLKHPPVIMLSDYKYFEWAEQDGYFVLPEKNPDGSLTLSPKIQYTNDQCALTGPVHSGAGNFAVSHGDRIFFVYGLMPQSNLPSGKNITEVKADHVAAWRKALPSIPPEHPANRMSFPSADGKKTMPASEGVPTFVVAYDRKTKKLSDPVFIGYGGRVLDGHNWPAITIDGEGILHVVMNGHIDPLLYTHSLKPYDITAWSEPVFVPREPGSKDYSYVSYASLNCDRHDNLVCVVRSDTGAYNHRLAVLRKPAGQPWAKEESLFVPFGGGYHVWTDKVTYDRDRDRFVLGFYNMPNQIQLNRLDYLFYRFYWPDFEKDMVIGIGRPNALNPGLPEGKQFPIYTPGPCEFSVMLSDDAGQSWRLATTPDFQPEKSEPSHE